MHAEVVQKQPRPPLLSSPSSQRDKREGPHQLSQCLVGELHLLTVHHAFCLFSLTFNNSPPTQRRERPRPVLQLFLHSYSHQYSPTPRLCSPLRFLSLYIVSPSQPIIPSRPWLLFIPITGVSHWRFPLHRSSCMDLASRALLLGSQMGCPAIVEKMGGGTFFSFYLRWLLKRLPAFSVQGKAGNLCTRSSQNPHPFISYPTQASCFILPEYPKKMKSARLSLLPHLLHYIFRIALPFTGTIFQSTNTCKSACPAVLPPVHWIPFYNFTPWTLQHNSIIFQFSAEMGLFDRRAIYKIIFTKKKKRWGG